MKAIVNTAPGELKWLELPKPEAEPAHGPHSHGRMRDMRHRP